VKMSYFPPFITSKTRVLSPCMKSERIESGDWGRVTLLFILFQLGEIWQ
jgi:hypothetical protein